MKRLPIALFALVVCMIIVTAFGETKGETQEVEQPLYEAVTNISFHIRKTSEDNSRRMKEVGPHKTLLVYEYGEQWCKMQYDNALGYCKTKWLYRYRSLQPEKAFVPEYPAQEGFAQVISSTHVSVKGYGGNVLTAGNLLSIHQWNKQEAIIYMMRSTATVAADKLCFTPYVPWKDAQKGDAIGGFTTYFNEKTGGKLSKNRQWNIELACRRVHGTVIPAGEAFSYNALCAPYRKANGYKMAPNISDNGQGYGGGVCQLTTTIYNALLCIPLQIEEWNIHRNSGVPYIPKGFDAAVGSYSDLIFRNTLPYDIRLVAMPQNGALTVLIYRD
jgi:hypothetical protein